MRRVRRGNSQAAVGARHSCPSYAFELDHDWNAALNVLKRGFERLGVVHSESTPGSCPRGCRRFGYRPTEVQEELGIPQGTATTTLARLHEDGYIGKTPDSYYHALEDREDLRRYVSSLDQLDRMFRHHTPDADPETPVGEPVDDAAAEAELAALEDELEDAE